MASQPLREPIALLTGFDAFAGAASNASWLAAQALHGRQVAGCRVVAACLPTVFGDSLVHLRGLLDLHSPVRVLCVGLASRRRAILIERVAINLDDAGIADNLGARPIDTPVVPRGPAAYFSSLPIKAMLQALQQHGLPAEVSQSAGTFVCNHVFYGLMHALATEPTLGRTRGGFVHVPELDVVGLPELVGGLHLLLEKTIRVEADLRRPAGTLID